MSNELLTLLLPLIGVIIGGSVAIVGSLLTKRQERKSQIYKILVEKRIDVYEKILTITKSFQLGTYKIENDEKISRPMALAKDAKTYTSIFLHYIEVTRNNNHLMDIDLRRKTTDFYNYLANLEQYLKLLRTDDGEWKDEKIIEKLGYMLNDDFVKLTSAIEVEISNFFSAKIYKSKFKSSTLDKSMNKKEMDISPEFLKLNLFKRENQIEELLKEYIENEQTTKSER